MGTSNVDERKRQFLGLLRGHLVEVYPIFDQSQASFRMRSNDIKVAISNLSGIRFKTYLEIQAIWENKRTTVWTDPPFGIEHDFLTVMFKSLKSYEDEELREAIENKMKLFEEERQDLKNELISRGFSENDIEEGFERVDDSFDLSFGKMFSSTVDTPLQALDKEYEQLMSSYKFDVEQFTIIHRNNRDSF